MDVINEGKRVNHSTQFVNIPLQRKAKRAVALFILLVPNISSTGEHRFFCSDTPTFRPKVTRKIEVSVLVCVRLVMDTC